MRKLCRGPAVNPNEQAKNRRVSLGLGEPAGSAGRNGLYWASLLGGRGQSSDAAEAAQRRLPLTISDRCGSWSCPGDVGLLGHGVCRLGPNQRCSSPCPNERPLSSPFGNTDHLAWDLGDPDANVVQTPINIKLEQLALSPPFGTTINGSGRTKFLHPMKGPMGTQTLRGLINHGAMHWRGDRVDGFFGKDTRNAAPFDSELAFKNFITAFDGPLGREAPLPVADMQAFTRFALALATPLNPVRALDNSLNAAQARGRRYFMGCDGLDSVTGLAVVCGADGRPQGGFAHGASGTNPRPAAAVQASRGGSSGLALHTEQQARTRLQDGQGDATAGPSRAWQNQGRL